MKKIMIGIGAIIGSIVITIIAFVMIVVFTVDDSEIENTTTDYTEQVEAKDSKKDLESEKQEKDKSNESATVDEEKRPAEEKTETTERKYTKAREENGGYLPKIELDDALKTANLKVEVTKINPVANHVAIWATVKTNLTTKLTYASARHSAVDIFEVLSKLDGYDTVTLIISAPGTDSYGNDKDVEALKVTLSADVINKINYDQFNPNNLQEISDYYETTE